MNTNPDFEREDALLNAVLRDETWQATDAACKAEALGAFLARQRVRRLARWTACTVALGAVVGCGVYWFGHPRAAPPQMAARPSEPPRESGTPRYLTDQELVASFPKGSCFLAEIDGKKKLVFLDRNVERQCFFQADH